MPGFGAATDAGLEPPQSEVPQRLVPEEVDAGHPSHEMSTLVLGRTSPRSRGASDFRIDVGDLRVVPRGTGGDFLKLAPGMLLTNEGGEGHPERIFLRGFDAREGQDIELTVDGVPINDSGNLHGNGFADLNFIIPELVSSLRVVEGPFDPRQGNYAVAGSADYEMGLEQRGLTLKGTSGTFNSQRLVALWGPPSQSKHTFAGVQVGRTDGFGQNRGAQSARVMMQYEGTLSDATSFRVAASGYGSQFRTAGVIRQDDFAAGRIGFFDSYDPRQGGEALRFQASADLHHHEGGFTNHHQAFVFTRSARLMENYTGFINDVQSPLQAPHGQRGDLLDRDTTAVTFGARGYGRYRARAFERPQEIELGYFARVDLTQGQQQRILAGPDSNTPYHKDLDLDSKLSDVGLYLDGNLSPLQWLVLRGGFRTDLFTYSVQNNCAVQDVRRPSVSTPPGDDSCLSQRDFGLYREPTERVGATGLVFMPRGTVLLGPWRDLTITASYGDGVRSIDPQFVNQNRDTPFAAIRAWEAGGMYAASLREQSIDVTARAVAFGTRVDKDLIFSQQEGRNVIGGSTSRLGALLQGRVRGKSFDVSAHATWVQSRFDETGLLVPYVPDLVTRADGVLFGDLPWRLDGSPLRGTAGVGLTFVGQRALPLGQRSDVIFVTDANAELRWRFVTVGIAATNLFNTQYRLAEFNYTADFRATPPSPTLVPSRLFTAGAPRQVLFTLAFNIGGAS
ncbi:MAG: TonB-dependent receptor plug domain-containing protein [Archangium sp.]|nr:TonB-dependent receptor plug domain-containing protein [Archangium sp.]